MQLFNIEQYELPGDKQVDFPRTKHLVGIFLGVYQAAREQVGLVPYPKTTLDGFLTEQELNYVTHEDTNGEQLVFPQKLFVKGYTSIIHPFRPEVTERRRKVFIYKYFHGLSVTEITDRINYQRNIVIDDSKNSMIQFAAALDLIILKK